MEIGILIVIIVTASIQSLFGVGVLLFGTPLLLLLGYPFLETLLILLPISASINLLQVLKDYREIDLDIYKSILLLTIPFIVVFLFLVSENDINVNFFIGFFLIFIAIKEYLPLFKIWFDKVLNFNKIFYITMGVIHGMTNLGGALLTAKIFHTNLNKYEKRATLAISYMTFALFQIATIVFLDGEYELENLMYIFVGLAMYLFINKFLFHKISDHKYDKFFSVFLIVSGVLLIWKGFVW
jgi:uncharacterized protein